MNFDLTEEQHLFRESVRKWVVNECPKDWCRDLERQEHQYPQELWDRLTRAGFHGVGVPEEYGGLGGDIITQALFAREFARHAGGLAWIWGITSFSGAHSIRVHGNEAQKQEFLPKMAAGELRAAMAFSEPSGGTDLLGGMKTEARRDGDGWRVNGEKIWSTTADSADYLLLMARSEKNPARRTDGITVFFVPRETPGVTVTPLPKLGMRALSSCAVHFEDAFVADNFVLGEAGKAWYETTKTLNNERILNTAMCLGMLDGVLEDALEHMKTRTAFGKTIGHFQVLQHYIADIAMSQKQVELLLYNTAWLQAEGKPCGVESTMAKTVASEAVSKAADRGISILGGMGYSAETDMQRYWRDSRLLSIGPISNEMARNMIAQGFGLPRSF